MHDRSGCRRVGRVEPAVVARPTEGGRRGPHRCTRRGRWVRAHMPPSAQAVRLAGDAVMALGASRRRPALLVAGALIVAAGWSHSWWPRSAGPAMGLAAQRANRGARGVASATTTGTGRGRAARSGTSPWRYSDDHEYRTGHDPGRTDQALPPTGGPNTGTGRPAQRLHRLGMAQVGVRRTAGHVAGRLDRDSQDLACERPVQAHRTSGCTVARRASRTRDAPIHP